MIFFSWQILQSEYVAHILYNKVNAHLFNEFGLDIKFKNIKFKLLPLGLSFSDVKFIRNKDNLNNIFLEVKEITICFDL